MTIQPEKEMPRSDQLRIKIANLLDGAAEGPLAIVALVVIVVAVLWLYPR